MTETTISNFRTRFYIPEIHKLAFHIPHVKILGKNHCGESRGHFLKRRESFQDVSIEGIILEHFSELSQTEINSSTKSCPRHAVFHSFL